MQLKTLKGRRFPVNNYHKRLLAAATDPEATDLYHQKNILRWAFRVSPGLPERVVTRGFNKLVARHDCLRMRFVDQDGTWQAEILDGHTAGLMIENISDLSEKEQNAEVLRRSIEQMTALSHPLFEAVLFKGGKAGDVLMLRGQHAILDGYSAVILIEEMIKLILNMPLGAAPPSYENYIMRNLRQAIEHDDVKRIFWRKALLPAPSDLNIGRKAKGLPPASLATTGKSISLENILSSEQAEVLAARSKDAGVTAFAYCYASYAETLCALAGQNEVIINSVIGRFDAAIRKVICADQQPIGIKYTCDPENLDQKAAWLSEMLQKAVTASPTNALLPDGDICQTLNGSDVAWFRFVVHSPIPTGRMSASPFKKIFEVAMKEKVHLGPLSFETIDLRSEVKIECEIQLEFTLVNGLPNLTLDADAASYDHTDLSVISAGIQSRLGL